MMLVVAFLSFDAGAFHALPNPYHKLNKKPNHLHDAKGAGLREQIPQVS